jgi:hypothetical protein
MCSYLTRCSGFLQFANDKKGLTAGQTFRIIVICIKIENYVIACNKYRMDLMKIIKIMNVENNDWQICNTNVIYTGCKCFTTDIDGMVIQ